MMAIAAHLEKSATPAGTQRREPRRTLRFEAEGVSVSGGAANVLVHNVSTTGLLLEGQASLEIGERIEIDLPHAGATWAKIIWTSGRLFGCQFDAPISKAALSAAQLRSDIGQEEGIAARQEMLPGESFGARLRRLRKERALTLSQIATELGVSKPTVWAWEKGKAHPVDSRIEALANALDVPSSELLTGRDTSDLFELLARSKEQIARAVGTGPEKVRIMIEL